MKFSFVFPQHTKILLFVSVILFSGLSLNAQTITGHVFDKLTDEPLIGASVVEETTNKGTMTDVDGAFQLTVSQKTGHIVVSYLGYESQTVSFDGDKDLKIYLAENINIIDEFVVVGYGIQKKSDLTGSISSVNTDDIVKMPTTNVVQALQGKAAGVEIVQNSGAPGSSTSIRIRGMGTINNSDPLYVVDGIPMDNIDYLSSDDISSVEILKDASSAAIYGSRAANGVVLVTTKDGKGSTKALNINFSSYVGFQEIWKDPDIMSKDDYIYFSDYVLNQPVKTENVNGRLQVKPEFQALLDNGNNWFDQVSRRGFMQKYNLALTGGDRKLNYYVSGNYQRTEGIIKESMYDKKSVNVKLNSQLLKNLDLGLNITYADEDRRVVGEGSWGVIKTALDFNPLTPLYDINGSYTRGTPVENLRRTTYDTGKNNIIGQLTLDWKIFKDLHFQTRASFNNVTSNRFVFTRQNTNPEIVGNIRFDVERRPATSHNYSWDNILTYTKDVGDHSFTVMGGQTVETADYEQVIASGMGYGGYSDYYDALQLAALSQSVAGYKTSWRALGLLGRVNYSYKSKYLFQSNFRADASSRFASKNRWGYFPSASVGWKINAEPFMEDIKFISLLKVRAGWGQLGNNRIDENFAYKTLVGQSGQYIYGTGLPSIKNALAILKHGNENIKWERTESTTIGLELNLFDNRFSSTVEYFTKNTRDMLIAVPIVYSAGFSNTPLQNAGKVNNKGFEIQMSYRDKIGNVKFEVGGNLTRVKNKVTSLGEANEPILGGQLTAPNPLGYVNRSVVGIPIACYYGYKTDGILTESDFKDGKPIVPVFVSSTPFQVGDMKFVDVNGDNKIDENDKTYLGSPHPDFFYAFNLNFEYKGFDLQMFFQGVAGNKIFNSMKYFQYSPVQYDGTWNNKGNNYSNVSKDYFDKVYRPQPNPDSPGYRDHWGANLNGTVPAPSSDDSRNQMNFTNSDFYIEDGSYLRLKNLQLGYNFSNKVCKRLKINNLRIYGSVTNVFTISPYSGLDPEVGKRVGTESNNLFVGIDEGTYPQARSYLFGLIFGF